MARFPPPLLAVWSGLETRQRVGNGRCSQLSSLKLYLCDMKLEKIRSDVGRAYFLYWRAGLKSLLGWPEDRIEQWAEKFRDYLSNEDDIFFNNAPAKYVLGEYLNEKHPGWIDKLKEKKGLEYHPIIYDLALCIDETAHPELRRGAGWGAAQRRIETAIKRIQI